MITAGKFEAKAIEHLFKPGQEVVKGVPQLSSCSLRMAGAAQHGDAEVEIK